MTFGPATYGLGLIAGALSTLSRLRRQRAPLGALALGAGLASSFAVIGIFLAAPDWLTAVTTKF